MKKQSLREIKSIVNLKVQVPSTPTLLVSSSSTLLHVWSNHLSWEHCAVYLVVPSRLGLLCTSMKKTKIWFYFILNDLLLIRYVKCIYSDINVPLIVFWDLILLVNLLILYVCKMCFAINCVFYLMKLSLSVYRERGIHITLPVYRGKDRDWEILHKLIWALPPTCEDLHGVWI